VNWSHVENGRISRIRPSSTHAHCSRPTPGRKPRAEREISMWSYEYSAATNATPEAIWPFFEDVAG
jgi:hypothetical protein